MLTSTNSGREMSKNCTASCQANAEDKFGYEAKDTSRQMYLVDESGCLGQMWSVDIKERLL